MGNFILIVAQYYASLYLRIHPKDFFRLCSMIGDNKKIKITRMKFLQQNPLLDQMGNFGLIVVQNYASSYLRIQSKGDNKSIKLNFVKFPKKTLLSHMGNFGQIVAKDYTNLYLSIRSQDFFLRLCSMKENNN